MSRARIREACGFYLESWVEMEATMREANAYLRDVRTDPANDDTPQDQDMAFLAWEIHYEEGRVAEVQSELGFDYELDGWFAMLAAYDCEDLALALADALVRHDITSREYCSLCNIEYGSPHEKTALILHRFGYLQ